MWVHSMASSLRCLLRNPPFCVCDSYFGFTIAFLFLFLAHFAGVYDIIIFESSFPSDFSWPPRVFDDSSYQSYQRTSDSRKIDYQEFSSSLVSSFEEWKLNSAFWRLENDPSEKPSFAPGMMGMISQIPAIKTHIKYLKKITTPEPGLPISRVCSQEKDSDSRNMGLIILVKSAVKNFAQRNAIRKTWAAEVHHKNQGNSYEVLFLLGIEGGNGVSGEGEFSYKHQAEIMEEQHKFGDLIQCQFVDTYFNNTSKIMAGIHFVMDSCPILDPRHGFLFLTDDDMFINVKNLEKLMESIKAQRDSQGLAKDVYLGYKFPSSKPKRWRFSKWYVSTNEYPFSWYPPYITAAAVLISKDTLEKLFYASHFVPLFRFDDIYLAILAHILQIESEHNGDAFYFDYLPFDEKTTDLYRDTVIAVHGYHDPGNMVSTFQKVQALTPKS